MDELTATDIGIIRGRLLEGRRAALARSAELDADRESIVAASASSNADDEHDPEGATIAFEREQVASMSVQARRRVSEVDRALARLDAGTYGRCEQCGQAIARERLFARPVSSLCVTHADSARRG